MVSTSEYRKAFATALGQLLDRHGVPASNFGRLKAFAALADTPISTAGRWLSGNGFPDLENLHKLCDTFKCSMDELAGRIPIKRENIDLDQTQRATYFSSHGHVDIDFPRFFLSQGSADTPIGVFRVVNDEMSGFVEPNDRVIFDLADHQVHSGSVYVLRVNGTLLVRRLYKRMDSRVDVLCDNRRYPSEIVDQDKFKSAGDACDGDIVTIGRVISRILFDSNTPDAT